MERMCINPTSVSGRGIVYCLKTLLARAGIKTHCLQSTVNWCSMNCTSYETRHFKIPSGDKQLYPKLYSYFWYFHSHYC
jgi:hypothetical protein